MIDSNALAQIGGTLRASAEADQQNIETAVASATHPAVEAVGRSHESHGEDGGRRPLVGRVGELIHAFGLAVGGKANVEALRAIQAAANAQAGVQMNMWGQWLLLAAVGVAGVTGMAFSLLHAYAAIHMCADQTISGTALNMIAPAAAIYFYIRFFRPLSYLLFFLCVL